MWENETVACNRAWIAGHGQYPDHYNPEWIGLAFRIVMIWVLEGRLAKVLPLLVYQTRGSCLRILSLMDGFEGGVCEFRGGIWNFEKVVWRAGKAV